MCERRLQYDALHRHWRCPDCRATYSPTALAAVCQEVERNARQLQRGIPGATALLRRAAEAGGALSRDVLLEAVTGAERHAMRWALRDVGDGPLSPERCHQAAQVLFAARMSAVGRRILAGFSGFDPASCWWSWCSPRRGTMRVQSRIRRRGARKPQRPVSVRGG